MGIFFCDAVLQGFHIAFAAGEGEESAFVIDEIFDLVGGEIFGAKKVEDDAGIEIAGAGGHGNAAGGSESHGGVDGFFVAKSAEAGAIAEMGENGAIGKSLAEVVDERFVG